MPPAQPQPWKLPLAAGRLLRRWPSRRRPPTPQPRPATRPAPSLPTAPQPREHHPPKPRLPMHRQPQHRRPATRPRPHPGRPTQPSRLQRCQRKHPRPASSIPCPCWSSRTITRSCRRSTAASIPYDGPGTAPCSPANGSTCASGRQECPITASPGRKSLSTGLISASWRAESTTGASP